MNAPFVHSHATRILASLLQSRTGQALGDSRLWRLETSLKPILRTHGIPSLDKLVDRLMAPGSEQLVEEVVNALLNNESSFYRDPHIFQTILQSVLPEIAGAKSERVLRIWSAACSTGQEPYSLAMALRQASEQWAGWRIQMLATDISSAAIARARSGVYNQMDVQRGLAINDLLRWFKPNDQQWRISPELTAMIDFRIDNLFECRTPSGQYDLILCRNVMLYFSPEMRRQVFNRLAKFCAPGAYLVLGAGETVIGQTEHFAPSKTHRGLYQRR